MDQPCILPVTGSPTWALLVAAIVLVGSGVILVRAGARQPRAVLAVTALIGSLVLLPDTVHAAVPCRDDQAAVVGADVHEPAATSTTASPARPTTTTTVPATTTTTTATTTPPPTTTTTSTTTTTTTTAPPPPPTTTTTTTPTTTTPPPTTTTTVPAPRNLPPTFRAPADLTIDATEDPHGDGSGRRSIVVPGFATETSPGGPAEVDQTVWFTVEVLEEVSGVASAADRTEPMLLAGDDAVGLTADGTLRLDLRTYHWGRLRLGITATDSGGASSPVHEVDVTVAPVDHISLVGDEGTCIPFAVPDGLWWGPDTPKLVFTEVPDAIRGYLRGGLTTVLREGDVVDAGDLPGCFEPRAHRHSTFDPVTGTYDPYVTYRFHVWSGRGDPITGELEDGAAATEISPTFTMPIVVRPVF